MKKWFKRFKKPIQQELDDREGTVEDNKEGFVDKQSDEPQIVVKEIVDQGNGQLKLDIDWNDAFVNYLKQSGYTGTEDQIIHKYIALVHKRLMEDYHSSNKRFD